MKSRAPYTDRPLTEEEKRFAEEHHDLMYRYMRVHHLDVEEWYDILIIPYLQAVKKYHEYEKLKSLAFEQIFFRTLDSARSNYWRAMNRKKRCPENGFICSFDDFITEDQDETFENFLIDRYTNVEKQIIQEELYKEFYNRCTERKPWQNDLKKTELDMLIQGKSSEQILKAILLKYKVSNDDGLYTWGLGKDIEDFRKIFKEVFGI